jgi:hypothetical protein
MNAITTTGPHPLRPQNFGELMEFAKMAARSTMVPRDYLNKPENILLAIQMGSEIGLAPMQSLQNISVINGRPAVWGDAMLGLCRQSPTCQDVIERFEGDGKTLTAVCIAKRVGKEPVERRFSMEDAIQAGLASKAGTWQQYPQRMLQMRARGFALRDAFPDVLRGLISTEEAQDIPEDKFAGKTIEAEPSEREAVNEQVPLRAAAASTKKPDRVVDPAVYEAPPQSTPRRTVGQLLESVEIALRHATSRVEVDRILDVEEVLKLRSNLPADHPGILRLNALRADALDRYPPLPDEDDEVHIAGEELAASG